MGLQLANASWGKGQLPVINVSCEQLDQRPLRVDGLVRLALRIPRAITATILTAAAA